MTPTDQYIKELEEFIKCREAATPGKWSSTGNTVHADNIHVFTQNDGEYIENYNESDGKFIAEAANKSADIARHLIEAIQILKKFSGRDGYAEVNDFLAKLNGVSE